MGIGDWELGIGNWEWGIGNWELGILADRTHRHNPNGNKIVSGRSTARFELGR
ncbi:hypothetical protein [Microcoleus sp. B4-D4]|uniref:hypothetical protein n=1 Tax=Microcoleus sp. B4-D4 TaxID=2818667 RepID=UPI002FD7385D